MSATDQFGDINFGDFRIPIANFYTILLGEPFSGE
jgi:hypothetical protein